MVHGLRFLLLLSSDFLHVGLGFPWELDLYSLFNGAEESEFLFSFTGMLFLFQILPPEILFYFLASILLS